MTGINGRQVEAYLADGTMNAIEVGKGGCMGGGGWDPWGGKGGGV